MALGIPLAFVIENLLTAALIITYLFYELRWGRGAHLMDQLEGLTDVVVALARQDPTIDDARVAERLNGDGPAHYVEEEE